MVQHDMKDALRNIWTERKVEDLATKKSADMKLEKARVALHTGDVHKQCGQAGGGVELAAQPVRLSLAKLDRGIARSKLVQ